MGWERQGTIKGPPGSNGARGSWWHTGEGEPDGQVSNPLAGDHYLDSDTGHVYARIGDDWVYVADITGPPGQTGATGAKGDTGAAGATGSAGEPGAKGDTGSQGPPGNTGPPGEPGTTAWSGLTGVPASLTNLAAAAWVAYGATQQAARDAIAAAAAQHGHSTTTDGGFLGSGIIQDAHVSAAAAILPTKLGAGRAYCLAAGVATSTNFWRGTLAQFNAVSPKDANTIYFVT